MKYGKRENEIKFFSGYQVNCPWKQILNLRPPDCEEKTLPFGIMGYILLPGL